MSKRKKVMYFISSNKKGIGGHYYSLKTTAEALEDVIDPLIVVIGKVKSPVIELTHIPKTYIYSNGWNVVAVVFQLINLIKKEKVDIVHSFDWQAFFYVRIMSFLFKIPQINTLPGGGNPIVYFPYSDNLILYSKENFTYFQLNKKFKESNLYCIPNRIGTLKEDTTRINKLSKYLDCSRKTFLRISRFALHYLESIKQAINLVVVLNKQGFKAQLIIIGTVEEQVVYDDIIKYIKSKNEKNIFIFTENYFTVNASELINIADFIIGTGRGLMESAAMSKVLLTPVKNSEYPALINEKNFIHFFSTNFSPRNQVADEKSRNLEEIKTLFKEPKKLQYLRLFSKEMFMRYFDITAKKREYDNLYNTVVYNSKHNIFEFIEHFLRQLRSVTRK